MLDLRDFVPGQFYAVTRRGNNGQWVFKDEEDFLKALSMMGRKGGTMSRCHFIHLGELWLLPGENRNRAALTDL